MCDNPILVAFDGSDGAHAALRWALAEAARRALPVHLVTVLDAAEDLPVAGLPAARDTPRPLVEAESVLHKVVCEARAAAPGVEVSGRAVAGAVTGTLCSLSRRASMVVLGSRGLGGFATLLVGSVSVAVTAHAHCPVVVVREDAHDPAGTPVVLGVDDSPQARLAARFAFDEAATRGVELVAVHAWDAPRRPDESGRASTVDDDRADALREMLRDVLDDAHRSHPRVAVAARLVAGRPADVLSALSWQAQLLVVGTRGRGGFHGLLLGSVSHQVLHHAHCPVAVVREGPLPAGRAAGPSIVDTVVVPSRVTP